MGRGWTRVVRSKRRGQEGRSAGPRRPESRARAPRPPVRRDAARARRRRPLPPRRWRAPLRRGRGGRRRRPRARPARAGAAGRRARRANARRRGGAQTGPPAWRPSRAPRGGGAGGGRGRAAVAPARVRGRRWRAPPGAAASRRARLSPLLAMRRLTARVGTCAAGDEKSDGLLRCRPLALRATDTPLLPAAPSPDESRLPPSTVDSVSTSTRRVQPPPTAANRRNGRAQRPSICARGPLRARRGRRVPETARGRSGGGRRAARVSERGCERRARRGSHAHGHAPPRRLLPPPQRDLRA